MLLRTPHLDDRRFQDIVDELKSRIPLYCPEWTDHNVSDPGVTLIELFAYLAEQLIFRMNQVPDLHYMRFVQFLGIPIPTPQAAQVAVSFWLNKPLPAVLVNAGAEAGQSIPIAKGTRVSTTQTENTAPLVFSILENARVSTPFLADVRKDSRDGEREPPLPELLRDDGPGVALFSSPPRTGDRFTFYFANDLSNHILQFNLELEDRRGTDIRTDEPPVRWEVFSANNAWERIEPGDCEDSTKGLNSSGTVRLYLPRMARIADKPGAGTRYGVRMRVENEEYRETPHLLCVREIAALGITLAAAYQEESKRELLGVSDGSPGQRFRLNHGPMILPLDTDETLEVDDDTDPWIPVDSFAWPQRAAAGPGASPLKCFTVDVISNEICLPPATKRPDGEIITYGAVPPRNKAIVMRRYRYGGGALDIPRGAVNVLKVSDPNVDRVENRYPASGGQEELPSLEALRIETQRFLRGGTRNRFVRAVTAEEYENLVLESFPDEIGKAECRLEQLERAAETQPKLEHLTVYVTGKVPLSNVLWGAKVLEVRPEVLARIDQLLHHHRLLTSRVRASNPQFIPLDVTVTVLGQRDAALDARIQEVAAAYLNPIYGGENGAGWRLDQRCTSDELFLYLKSALQPVVQVQFRTVKLDWRDPRLLFTIEAKEQAGWVDSLNSGAVSDQLINIFRSHNQYLPDQAKARVLARDHAWSVADSNRKYRIRLEDGDLSVFNYQGDPPEARLQFLRSLKVVYE
jgi:hypothetical protein